MTATGDIVMGMAPGGLPPNNGKGFFDPVKASSPPTSRWATWSSR